MQAQHHKQKTLRYGGCPIRSTTAVFAGKWKIEILWHLAFGKKRFAELRELLPGLTEKVLAAQLKSLHEQGVISRDEVERKPLRVDYALTDSGRDLIFVLENLCNWGVQHLHVPPTMTGRPPMLDRPASAMNN